MAIRVGARPKACSETARSSAKPNYAYGCQTCGWKVYRYRLRRELRHHYCAKCGGELTFYRVRKEGDE
jgi:predicted SprT family Zn-dependent metalloprotease